MDAVPIDVVIEAPSDCSDRVQAEAQLSSSLAAARAPRRGGGEGEEHWRLGMRVTRGGPGIKVAAAEIRDDRGTLVTERSIRDRTAGSCFALVRAIGAWAQIVLDDELARANESVSVGHDADAAGPGERTRESTRRPSHGEEAPATSQDETVSSDDLPGGEPRPPLGGRTVEVGSMVFLRSGVEGTGGLFGAAPFVTIAVASSWVLRPSLMYGTSALRAEQHENLKTLGGRVDLCRRIPGNYIDHRGIELDLCGGSDLASIWSSHEAVTRMTLGPSAVLRGQLPHDIGIEVRTLAGVSPFRERWSSSSRSELPLIAGVELGGSVRLR